MNDLDNFFSEFDELTQYVIASRHQFFEDNLKRWFEALDETSVIAEVVTSLEYTIDIQQFLKNAANTKGSMVGSGVLNWPAQREKRLGTQLLLFREIASKRIKGWQFAVDYTYAGSNNLNDNVTALADQIFRPFAGDLRRFLKRQTSNSIPASDRVVQLNHNSPEYKNTIDALETLEQTIVEANDYEDVEDKEQKIAEVSAGRRLMQAAKIRVAAISAVLSVPILYLIKKFIDTGIGKAATACYDALLALFGTLI